MVATRQNAQKTVNGSGKSTVANDLKTDYTRWRMLDENGRQTWHYLSSDAEVKDWPQTMADKHYLGLPKVPMPPMKVLGSSTDLTGSP